MDEYFDYDGLREIFAEVPDYIQFIDDMEEAGLPVQEYHGRWHYWGPASSCDHFSDVMAATQVKCDMDNLGLGYIVHPRSPGVEFMKKIELGKMKRSKG